MTAIIRFAIDPKVLRSAEYGTNVHRRILRMWRDHGTLLFNDELRRAAEEAPDQEVRGLWLGVLLKGSYRVERHSAAMLAREAMSREDFLNFSRRGRLVAVRGEVAVRLQATFSGLPQPKAEICAADEVDCAACVRVADAHRARAIDVSDPADDVWRDQLEELARVATHVTIVDPYALAEHVEFCKKRG